MHSNSAKIDQKIYVSILPPKECDVVTNVGAESQNYFIIYLTVKLWCILFKMNLLMKVVRETPFVSYATFQAG